MSLVIDNVNVTDKKALGGFIKDVGTSVNRHFMGEKDQDDIPQTDDTKNQEPVEGIDNVNFKSNIDYPENPDSILEKDDKTEADTDYQEDQTNSANDDSQDVSNENDRLPKVNSENVETSEINQDEFGKPHPNFQSKKNMDLNTELKKVILIV